MTGTPCLPAGVSPGLHRGRAACTGVLRSLLCQLGEAGDGLPSEVWACDAQFADWPLDEAPVLDSLLRWLRPPRRSLRLVGLHFDAVARRFPRFARWRRDWIHRIEVGRPVDGLLPDGARGLLVGPVALQWLDAPDWRLRVVDEPAAVQAMREQYVALWQQCEPAWPGTTVGL